MRLTRWMIAALLAASLTGVAAQAASADDPNDHDQTLHAMRDEMARAKSRLSLTIPGLTQPVTPYYIEYRLLDLDVREIVGDFGALLSTTHTRTRFMDVSARVGVGGFERSPFTAEDVNLPASVKSGLVHVAI